MNPFLLTAAVISLSLSTFLLVLQFSSGNLPQPTPAEVNGFLQQSERIWSE